MTYEEHKKIMEKIEAIEDTLKEIIPWKKIDIYKYYVSDISRSSRIIGITIHTGEYYIERTGYLTLHLAEKTIEKSFYGIDELIEYIVENLVDYDTFFKKYKKNYDKKTEQRKQQERTEKEKKEKIKEIANYGD